LDKGSRTGLLPGTQPAHNTQEVVDISHNELWLEIRKRVLSKYDYNLPEFIPAVIFTVPTLRAICNRVGIQLQARNSDLTSEKPFSISDILQLFPVIKHSEPITADGCYLLEASKVYLAQGRLDIAYELLSEALAVLHQVYGPMH